MNEFELCPLCNGMGVLSPEIDYVLWGSSIICPLCKGSCKKEVEK